MNTSERLATAERAKIAMEVVSPILEAFIQEKVQDIIRVAGSTDPKAPQIQDRLGLSVKVINELSARIQAQIEDGKMVEETRKREAQLSKINPHKRQILGV